MSLHLSHTLLPKLRSAFPDQRMQLGPEEHILATFYSPNPEVGYAAIQDDGDEITLFLAGRTHLHIGCYDDSLTDQQKAEDIASQVLTFLNKLFADEIEFFGTGASGGCRERKSGTRGLLSKLLLGPKSYVCRHYKGGEYEVVGVVRHSESLEPMVLYRPLYNDSGMWVRPFAMFLEPVEHAGGSQPRFSLVTAAASATEAELAATVQRMEARLSASKSAAVQQLMPLYHQLAVRFEQDLAARERDVLLAKASALMLVQAAAQTEGSP